MRKDKEIYTITVPCNGQDHQISLTKESKLELLKVKLKKIKNP
ncbi:hypothetical protein [Thermoanaerobacterium thermosaccharolyticum]